MIESPSLALAFVAGLVSFLSPCSLPLVPGYLAAVCGRDPESRGPDPAVLARSLMFVGTFSAIFILFGLSATTIGSLLSENSRSLNRIGGIAIFAMGLLFIAAVFIPRLNRDWRVNPLVERAGRGGPVVAGAAFAVAWTPCVGPTLGAILGLAATSTGTAEGGLLLAVYSAGLAVPFLVAAFTYDRAMKSFDWFKRHYAVIQVASGILLIGMGILVYTGELFRLNIEAQRAMDEFGLNFWQYL